MLQVEIMRMVNRRSFKAQYRLARKKGRTDLCAYIHTYVCVCCDLSLLIDYVAQVEKVFHVNFWHIYLMCHRLSAIWANSCVQFQLYPVAHSFHYFGHTMFPNRSCRLVCLVSADLIANYMTLISQFHATKEQ